MKLALGTAQFGYCYGVSNRDGQTPIEEVHSILRCAASLGIRVLDTAPCYGESEAVLGSLLEPGHQFQIVTKILIARGKSGCHSGSGDAGLVAASFAESLKRLRVPRVHALLVHNPSELLSENGPDLFKELQLLKVGGLVGKVGVSVYSAVEIDRILASYPIDIVQLPINIFDQRLLHSGHLRQLKRAGVEIYARSIFLQGLLLMSPEALPPEMSQIREHLANYRRAIAANGISPLAAALHFSISLPDVDVVLCGVNTLRQLQEIQRGIESPAPAMDWSQFALTQDSMLNPSRWSR
jgi:aryl-alcohol dehydrogenase-like predicted oxidoreductase